MFMADKSTFIKLDRNIQEWRWYTNANTFRVFVHLLLNANIKANDFENAKIKRGELATSYDKIANTLKLSNQQVRTAISHLKLTGEITVTRYSKFIVISIVNYAHYQDQSTVKSTINQQSFNNQSTFNQQQYKNNKNIKNGKNDYIPPVVPQGDTNTHHKKYSFGSLGNVMLTMDEYHRLSEDYPNKVDDAIEFLSNYIAEDEKRKKEYAGKDHNLVMRRWVFDAVREREERQNKKGYQEIESSLDFDLDDIFEKP